MTPPPDPRTKDEGPYLAAAWLIAASLFFFPANNPDIFWHLSAGREILRLGRIPASDWLSWTKTGRPWLDFEWLCQVLYYLVHAATGMAGLWLLKAGLFAATAWAVLRTARLHAPGEREQAGLLALLVLGLIPSLNPRPENFSLLFFALELWFLETRRLNGPRWSRLQEAGLAAAFFSLWANIHGGFAYGLALAAVYAVVPLSFTKFFGKAHLAAAAALGTLLNPYGPRLYLVFELHARLLPILQRHLVEWQSPSLANHLQWPYWGLLAVTALAVAAAVRRGRAFWFHVLVLCGLAFASLRVCRDSAYFCVAAAALLPALLESARRASLARLAPAILAGAAIFCALEAWPYTLCSPVWASDEFPVGATRFLKQEAGTLDNLRMFNPWGWGGYLGYELSPSYHVLMDGRYIFHDLLDPLQQTRASDRAWISFLDNNRIGLVLLRPSPQIYQGRPFYVFFMPRQDWALVYWDRTSLVFARRAAVPQIWLFAQEFQTIRPGDLDHARLAILSGETSAAAAQNEIDRLARETGDTALASDLRNWLSGLPAPLPSPANMYNKLGKR